MQVASQGIKTALISMRDVRPLTSELLSLHIYGSSKQKRPRSEVPWCLFKPHITRYMRFVRVLQYAPKPIYRCLGGQKKSDAPLVPASVVRFLYAGYHKSVRRHEPRRIKCCFRRHSLHSGRLTVPIRLESIVHTPGSVHPCTSRNLFQIQVGSLTNLAGPGSQAYSADDKYSAGPVKPTHALSQQQNGKQDAG